MSFRIPVRPTTYEFDLAADPDNNAKPLTWYTEEVSSRLNVMNGQGNSITETSFLNVFISGKFF